MHLPQFEPLTPEQACLEGDLVNLDPAAFLVPGTRAFERALDGLRPLFQQAGLVDASLSESSP
jgi:hypothetical protein